MAKKILAAIDGSEHAWKALDLAADMAKQSGAQLIVLHVVPYEPMSEALRAFAEAEHMPAGGRRRTLPLCPDPGRPSDPVR